MKKFDSSNTIYIKKCGFSTFIGFDRDIRNEFKIGDVIQIAQATSTPNLLTYYYDVKVITIYKKCIRTYII